MMEKNMIWKSDGEEKSRGKQQMKKELGKQKIRKTKHKAKLEEKKKASWPLGHWRLRHQYDSSLSICHLNNFKRVSTHLVVRYVRSLALFNQLTRSALCYACSIYGLAHLLRLLPHVTLKFLNISSRYKNMFSRYKCVQREQTRLW